MALRRFFALLRISARRAMAASPARGHKSRARAILAKAEAETCPTAARVRGIRGHGEKALNAADAHVRAMREQAESAFNAALASADARVRNIRAEGEAAFTAAVASTDARVRAIRAEGEAAVRALLVSAHMRTEEAARRLRHGLHVVLSRLMVLAYGECQPKIPTVLEILDRVQKLMDNAHDIEKIYSMLSKLRELFDLISPIKSTMIFGSIIGPIVYFYKTMVVPAAVETVCPFVGVRSMEFDEIPVLEGLRAVFFLSARCGGMVILYLGCLSICICVDLGTHAAAIFGWSNSDGNTRQPLLSIVGSTSEGEVIIEHHLEWGRSF